MYTQMKSNLICDDMFCCFDEDAHQVHVAGYTLGCFPFSFLHLTRNKAKKK